ncbi:DUF1127 domain-containing protein [Aeromonas cavernicola]|uniref:YjiS-like domain-containing protein n=1 Tax=Aeromonas cavernicola TaxID=1006623 RepID=A0A2H9U4R7_9GAMM|nr:DUF1127 domain-containing protein [Aeromonas cavernicola]PJG59007.1 hypothetical protein CUC53_09600 [Aeromonas cavernicola]
MANMTYSHTCDTQAQPHSIHLLTHAKTLLLVWLERSRSRRQLSELPDYLLKDIGLNEADRYQETTKPFWRS